jgi:hypothetical protein
MKQLVGDTVYVCLRIYSDAYDAELHVLFADGAYGELVTDDINVGQGTDMTAHTIESLTMLISGGATSDRSMVAPPGVGNPIDKLYSMQTSYFNSS